MARVQTIKKARASKYPRRCRLCPEEVKVGEPYKKIEKKTGPRSSMTIFFCKNCEPRTSHRLSGRSAELAEIQEGYDDEVRGSDGLEDEVAALESFGENISEFAGSIRESAEAIEEGFGHETEQSTTMNETADAFEEWGDDMTNHAASFPGDDADESEVEDWVSERDSLVDQEPDLALQ